MEEATWEEELVFKGKFPTFSLASPCGKFIVEETKRHVGGKKRGQLEKVLTVLDGTNRKRGGRKGQVGYWWMRGVILGLCSVT